MQPPLTRFPLQRCDKHSQQTLTFSQFCFSLPFSICRLDPAALYTIMNGHHSHGGYCRPLFAPVMDPWGEIPKWEPCGRCGGGMPPTLDPIYPDPQATDSISQSRPEL
ncbi:hypothetical protein L596_006284 [Steinernema carpocapsae]|uniref:Uncharacterized protein n=1 Tax=Steinernema carpocapsae TaxID=34508 RepID=A0A4U8V1P3_STECR|nr:hypothetical protein L596_006284 [Steinernema carpocapsae]